MPKFDFSITTRDGQKVEGLHIFGKDQPDAERKLFLMYRHCEVIQSSVIDAEKDCSQSADIEDMLTLIVKDR
jgi:hypothetical protein